MRHLHTYLALLLALAVLVTCKEPTAVRKGGKPTAVRNAGPRDDPLGETPVYPLHHEAPAWSSTGLIAYEDHGVVCADGFRVWRDTTLAGLYVLNPRTHEKKRLLRSGSMPTWSRDGTRIAVSINGKILSLNADGTDLRSLTPGGGNWYPSWSPDGQWIAYDNVRQHTWIMRADGSERQSIGEESGREPCWHPFESLIVHIRFPFDECGAADLYVMDGRRGWLYGTRMMRNGFDDHTPDYSQDGQRIAFSSARGGCSMPEPGADLKSHIWIMQVGETEARQLTRNPGGHPSWAPDGSKIVYTRQDWNINTPENGVLWIVDVAAGEESQLTFRWPQRCSTPVSDMPWTNIKRKFR